jgi:glycerophosphoryl diester phosphodiesterase
MHRHKRRGTVFLCLLFLVLPCLYGAAQATFKKAMAALDKPSKDYILVAAHRCDWRNAPENSLQGLRNCIAMGVDIAEIDVQMTKDRQLVILHDKTLDRTTTGTGPVKQYTLDSLRKLYLKDGLGVPTRHMIPTLQEFLDEAKGRIILFIDKGYACLPEAYALVQEAGMEKQCLFEGKEPVEKFKADYPALYNQVRYMPRVKENDQAEKYMQDYRAAIDPAAFIITYKDEASSVLPLIAQLTNANVPVLVGTLWPETCAGHDDEVAVQNPDASWAWVIDKGANILCTDRPAMMLVYLRKKRKHD